MMPDFASMSHVARNLERDGYCVLADFLADEAIASLAQECRGLHARAQLRPAGVGRGERRVIATALRGDLTRWLDTENPTAAATIYWSHMHELRHLLNRELLLGLEELEAHFALYAPGMRYARHRDRFRNDDARVISSVLYLNQDWRESDGGALRLYPPTSVDPPVNLDAPFRDVYPAAGRLVLFLSADIEHEVLVGMRERLSIAGWFRRRAER